jgi:transposase InsO family protein
MPPRHCSSSSCAQTSNAAGSHRTQRGGLGVHGQPRSGAEGHVQVERPGAARAVVRYENEAPGDLLHTDTKKLGRIVRPSHRFTGNRRDSVDGPGWETLFVAIDDRTRLAFTAMHPAEKQAQAVLFLRNAVACYARLGITLQPLLTDNGSAFRSREFKKTCIELGIKHSFTRPYRPPTNGKAERFIQSALRVWAYSCTNQNSAHRTDALASWQHHYNWHRPHSGIGGVAPMSRLDSSRNNLLTLHI